MNRFAIGLSALLVVLSLSGGTTARADYLYTVSGLPAPVVSGQSIAVLFANPGPIQPLPGHANADVIVANLVGFSANTGTGDNFNTPFTLKMDFTDPAVPGSAADASFGGILSGNLTTTQSSLFVKFASPTDHITLAGNTYAVSVAPSTQLFGNGTQETVGAHIQYTGTVNDVPEPTALLLAGFGVPLLGLGRVRKMIAASRGKV